MSTTLEILIRARDEFSAELKRMEGSLQKNQRNVTRLGLGMTAAGAAGAAGFGLAIKGAIDFESSFAGVRKTVDATEEEFARLEEGFRSMAKQTPINVNEINRIGEAAGQLGIEVENIEGFTKVMADLGVATNLASDQAATSLARLANITQLPQTEFDRLGSTVVALGNNLATTESEIVDFGLRIAGAGNQIGLSEAQILALGGALSSVGISAEAGGTALSRVMVDIAKAVDEGGEKLGRFAEVAGLSADEFREAFERDAAGAIVTFVEGLGKVKEAGGSTFQVLEDLGQGNIRVRDALLRASGAGDLLRRSLELGTTAWEENTALTEEAEKRYGTTASQLQLLQNRVGDVAISIGQDFLPVLNQSLEVTGDAIELWNVLPEPIQEASVRLGAAASGMALFSGALILALPRMAAAATAFRTLWAASMLFRTSMIGGVGLIAAITVVPPLLNAMRGSHESAAAATARHKEAANELAGELANVAEELSTGVISRRLSEITSELGVFITQSKKFGDAGFDATVAEAAAQLEILATEAAAAGIPLNEIEAIMRRGGVAADEIAAALTGVRREQTQAFDVQRLRGWADAMADGAAATAALAKAQEGLAAAVAAAEAELFGQIDTTNDILSKISKLTGVRTQEAVAMDLQTNALEQQRVAAQLAMPAFDAQLRAIEREIGALDLSKAAIGGHITALEREISTLNLNAAAIQAQIQARDDLAAATLEAARIVNLPQMVEQKKLELEREKILDKVGGAVEDLTDADKERLEGIDDELRALRTSMNVKRLEAELTNVQREASDDFRDALKEQLRAIEDEIRGLAGQRDQLGLNQQAIGDNIGALQTQRGELSLVAQAYDDNITAIETQITKQGLQKEAIDLVTTAWGLQAQAMADLPTLKDIASGLMQFKELLILQARQQMIAAISEGNIAAQQAIAENLNSILAFQPPSFAHGGFIPPGVVTPAILHGGAKGEAVIPLDRFKSEDRPRELHIHYHNSPAESRRQLRAGARDFADQIERDHLLE